MKYRKLIFIFLFFPIVCFGQRSLVISPGVSYQKGFYGELNLMCGEFECEHGFCGFWLGYRVGMETNFNPNHFIYAPKIGCEISFLPIALRANTVGYIKSGVCDLRLLPEIGLSFVGTINLTYGYGISVLKDKIPEVGRHRVALVLNLGRDNWDFFF